MRFCLTSFPLSLCESSNGTNQNLFIYRYNDKKILLYLPNKGDYFYLVITQLSSMTQSHCINSRICKIKRRFFEIFRFHTLISFDILMLIKDDCMCIRWDSIDYYFFSSAYKSIAYVFLYRNKQ